MRTLGRCIIDPSRRSWRADTRALYGYLSAAYAGRSVRPLLPLRRWQDEMSQVTPAMDLPFPTFVVGSLPRSRWIRDIIEDRKSGRLAEDAAEHLLDDAIPSAIRLQER